MIALSELQQPEEQLDAVERDAEGLVAGLTEEGSGGRARPNSWSVVYFAK
jgi:hypothetical protein